MARLARTIAMMAVIAPMAFVACGKSQRDEIAWHHDLDSAKAAAAQNKRPVFVFVDARWDRAGRELEQRTFVDPEVKKILHDYVAVSIDVTDDESREAIAIHERLRITGLPTMIVLAPDLRTELWREVAYVDPPVLSAALRAARSSI